MNMVAIAEARVLGDEAGGHHRADAKERAVRERGQHACGQQQFVSRRQRASCVAEREDRHQGQQHGLPRHTPRRQRQDRRADEHAERIA
jgi:hypothetical protein